MRLSAMMALLLLGPPGAVELRYRFEKGLVYEDVQERRMDMEYSAEGKAFVWKLRFSIHLERTILRVDETAHPSAEKVVVRRFRRRVIEAPDETAGAKPFACEGKTFLWKRLKERWGLFEEDDDVTGRYKQLVDHLKRWRDARLPKSPVAPGDSWEVTAEDFLRTAGLPVPKAVKGAALFTLERIEKGIASISFHIRFFYRRAGLRQTVEEKGTWRFDTGKGRDLSLEMNGTIEVEGGGKGKGRVELSRRVTYR